MAHIKLVTDSTADIPLHVRKEYGIETVPLKIHVDGESYLDGVTLDSESFYEKLLKARTLPVTSQPSPSDFLETYRRLANEPGVSILSIHLSSALSGTYQSALLARSMMEDGVDLEIIDSKSASYGIGMLVVEAAKAIRQGKSKEECLERIRLLRKRAKLYFLVDTLEYLEKGGRIGKASAVLGSLLNIKPILSLDDEGEVFAVDKVRGQKKAMANILERFRADFSGQKVSATIAHAHALSLAREFGGMLEKHFDLEELQYTSISPVIGAHVGPGTVGVFMWPVLP